MALTKKDLTQIQNIMTAGFAAQDARFDHRLKIALDQQAQDIKRDIRDEMDARFTAFRNEMRSDMRILEERIRADVLHLVSDNILPAIDRLHEEIGAVRRFVGMA